MLLTGCCAQAGSQQHNRRSHDYWQSVFPASCRHLTFVMLLVGLLLRAACSASPVTLPLPSVLSSKPSFPLLPPLLPPPTAIMMHDSNGETRTAWWLQTMALTAVQRQVSQQSRTLLFRYTVQGMAVCCCRTSLCAVSRGTVVYVYMCSLLYVPIHC